MDVLRLNKKGFTLIELLVAISIMSLISTIVVANYRDNEEVRKLKNQAELMVDGLEKAQNMALTGRMINDKIPIAFQFSIEGCNNNCEYEIKAIFSDDVDSNPIVDSRQFTNLRVNNNLKVDFLLPRANIKVESEEKSIKLENNSNGCYQISIDSISDRINLEKCPNQ